MNNKIKKNIKDKLKKYFSRQNEIIAAYIFGSFLKQRFNNRSDIDLAVIFREKLDKFDRFNLKLKMIAEIEELINREIDLIDFEKVDLKIQHQILDGELLYCNNNDRRVKLEKKTILNYIDMKRKYEIISRNLGGKF